METELSSKMPIIGVTASLLPVESGPFIGCEWTTVIHDYILSIEKAGGVPIVLPVVKNPLQISRILETVDGILLSGGYDLSPLSYEEEPLGGLGFVYAERDAYEIALVKSAVNIRKPIFAICRGMQVLNVALEGNLHQDLSSVHTSWVQHRQQGKYDQPSHSVDIIPKTLLSRLLGVDTLSANTFHHQAIKKLGAGLKVNARAKDGIIEGVEGVDSSFVLGVQWHPEVMVSRCPTMLKLFHAFVHASRGSK